MTSATAFTGKRPRQQAQQIAFEVAQKSLQNSEREIDARISDCQFELFRLHAMKKMMAAYPSVGEKSMAYELFSKWEDWQERLNFMIDTALPKSKSRFARVLRNLGFFTFTTDSGFDGAGNQILMAFLTRIEASDTLKLQFTYALFETVGHAQHCEKFFELLGAHPMFHNYVITGKHGSDDDDDDDEDVSADCHEQFPNDAFEDHKLSKKNNFIHLPQAIFDDLSAQLVASVNEQN